MYKPKHRLAAELLPIAQAGLGGEGSAVVDAGTNSIVLIGERPAVASALALVEEQDRRPRTIVLRYESRRLSELEESGVRVEWSVRSGGVRVGNARFPAGSSGLRLSARERAERERSSFSGVLRLLEGRSGRISSGTQLPVTVRRHSGHASELVSVESGFDARARVLGDGRVHVELAPFEGSLAGARRIETAAAETELDVQPGETVVVGELRAQRSLDADAPAARSDEESSDERVLLLTATVE